MAALDINNLAAAVSSIATAVRNFRSVMWGGSISKETRYQPQVDAIDRSLSEVDKILNGEPASRPFSTYLEDRARLLALANKLQRRDLDVEDARKAADELSDLVLAILNDEAIGQPEA
ncbi:hypothetical protein DWF00_16505 [Bosea caraganae]|uniref:Uncharacterized protein n=1 Tax=Bosea caraganae TaxID=2763117 RepID=A0A370KZU5_9HYPH|nr:hypothetical protein [Bosea caraganae]RDJ20112.1 hypothetical protein DWE98_26110 [Bosea caraganae]RDJ24824.1 hypothetical protein DWF00_16505 [Bosea caraganae]